MEAFEDLLIKLIKADTWVQYVSVFLISIVLFLNPM